MTLEILQQLQTPTFATALAALVRGPGHELPTAKARVRDPRTAVETGHVLSAKEPSCACNEKHCCAPPRPCPGLSSSTVIVAPRIEESLCFADAVARVVDGTTDQTDYCRQMLARPANELNPPPLITGEDLMQMGIPRGPVYRELLDRVRMNNWPAESATAMKRAAPGRGALERWSEPAEGRFASCVPFGIRLILHNGK